jgi:hypothetical protein
MGIRTFVVGQMGFVGTFGEEVAPVAKVLAEKVGEVLACGGGLAAIALRKGMEVYNPNVRNSGSGDWASHVICSGCMVAIKAIETVHAGACAAVYSGDETPKKIEAFADQCHHAVRGGTGKIARGGLYYDHYRAVYGRDPVNNWG